MDMKPAVNALEALAHETRLGVFRLLVQATFLGDELGDDEGKSSIDSRRGAESFLQILEGRRCSRLAEEGENPDGRDEDRDG